jgi:plasmid stabilization system protein ParE
MALNVSLHRRAEDDLRAILNYITRQADRRTAERVRSDIMRRLRILSSSPRMGAPSSQRGVRMLQPTRYPYRIYYTVQGDDIVILHIRHTSRQAPGDL